ncbi:MAG: hypothetical protein IPJ78_02965 [Gemmatimonadetes bacterium]|nr:hypothetical protein [Gemmatimonadota bacterium]
MKKLAIVASLVLFAACAPKEEAAPATEMAAPAPAAMTDTAAMADTTKKDSTGAAMPMADTTKH